MGGASTSNVLVRRRGGVLRETQAARVDDACVAGRTVADTSMCGWDVVSAACCCVDRALHDVRNLIGLGSSAARPDGALAPAVTLHLPRAHDSWDQRKRIKTLEIVYFLRGFLKK
jgi:hypothetical protein